MSILRGGRDPGASAGTRLYTGEAPRTSAAPRPWLALSALCTGFFMTLLDTTIVNIAIPSMLSGLATGLENVIWVNSVYLLLLAVPLLVTGRLGDRYGPKRVFLVGLALFTTSSLACGLAPSIGPLIAARGLQGLGAAAMIPQTMAFVHHLFPAGRRGAAMGIWGATAGLALLSGPLLGGVLVEGLGWQWVFFVNVPIGLAGMAMTVRLVPDWRPEHSRRLDPLGIALFSVGLAAVIFGLQEGERYGWGTVAGPVTVWWLLGGGLALLALFAAWQRHNPVEPLLPVQLLGHRSFCLSIVANAALGFAVIGSILPLMLYLQTIQGHSAVVAGLFAAPMAIASGATSALAGRIAEQVDARRLAAGGFLCYATGLASLALVLRVDSPLPALLLPLFLAGVGAGAVFVPLATLGTLSLPAHLVGGGSGLFNTLRQVGSVVGSAAVGVLLQARLATELASQATSRAILVPAEYREPFAAALAGAAGRLGMAGGGAGPAHLELPGAPPDVAEQVRSVAEAALLHGSVDAVRAAVLLPACVLLVGVAACLSMPRPSVLAVSERRRTRRARRGREG